MFNKKIFLIVICSILLLGTISAFDFDNRVNYKNNYLTIEIYNAFGLGDTLMEATLKSHNSVEEVINVIPGRDRVVMYYDFEKVKYYKNGLGEVTFTDLRTGKEIEKNYYFAEAVYETIQKPIVKKVCSEEKNNHKICLDEFLGYEEEEVIKEWKRLENNDIPDKKVRIALITDVNKGDYVDGIWTIGGKKVNRHAAWQDSFDTDLLEYYYFNNGSSYFGNEDFINSEGSVVYSTTGCKSGMCMHTSNDTIANAVTETASDLFNIGLTTENRTINFWFDPTTGGSGAETFFAYNPASEWGIAEFGVHDYYMRGLDSPQTNIEIPSGMVMITIISNDSGVFVYNNSIYFYTSTKPASATSNFYIGKQASNATKSEVIFDDMAIWNRSLSVTEINNLYDGGTGTFYDNDTYVDPSPTITLTSPANNTNFSTQSITFQGEGEDADLIENISLWLNGQLNYTEVIGDTNESSFSLARTLPDGLWNWTLSIDDNATETNTAFAANRTLTIDTTKPFVNVTYPIDQVNFHAAGNNLTINLSISDTHIGNCKWSLDGGVNNFSIPCTYNNVSINITYPTNNTFTIWVNDTFGNENYNISSWDYVLFQNSLSYTSEAYEGTTETFSLNATKSSSLSVSTVSLVYNGSSNSAPYSTNGDEVTSSVDITIPSQTAEINVSFYWNLTFTNGNSYSTEANNQTILVNDLDDCSVYTNLVYNLTQYDEENQSVISNGTMEVNLNFYNTAKTLQLINFSQKFEETNPAQICIQNQLTTITNYSSYMTVKYYSNVTPIANTTNLSHHYAIEYYHVLNQTVGNSTVPINIALYNLKEEDATKFRLTFRDSDYVLAPNILVHVDRQFVSSGDFKTVEIPLTDGNGQTILNLVRNDIIYNFVMVNEGGQTVATFNQVTAFCSDYTIGECTINLNADPVGSTVYDYNDEFDISLGALSYDNSTGLVSFDFFTGDLLPQTVSVDIVRNNDFGNRSVCTNSLTSASGTLTCDVSSIVDSDRFLFIDILVNNSLAEHRTIVLDSGELDFTSSGGFFYAFLLILLIITIFMEDKKILVIALGIGWIVCLSLGLLKGAIIGSASSGIWLLVTIMIFLWKLRKEEGTYG